MPAYPRPPNEIACVPEEVAIPRTFRIWLQNAHGIRNSTAITYCSALRRLWERGAFNPAVGPDVAMVAFLRTHETSATHARVVWQYRRTWAQLAGEPPLAALAPPTRGGVTAPPRAVLETLARVVAGTAPGVPWPIPPNQLVQLRWVVIPWHEGTLAIKHDLTHFIFRETDAAVLLAWGCPETDVQDLPNSPVVPCFPGSLLPVHPNTVRAWLRTMATP